MLTYFFVKSNFHNFAANSNKELKDFNGGLAQLARAFDWQSKGHRFESGILHADLQCFAGRVLQGIFYLY
jgi:hypothetical protein